MRATPHCKTKCITVVFAQHTSHMNGSVLSIEKGPSRMRRHITRMNGMEGKGKGLVSSHTPSSLENVLDTSKMGTCPSLTKLLTISCVHFPKEKKTLHV